MSKVPKEMGEKDARFYLWPITSAGNSECVVLQGSNRHQQSEAYG